MTIRHTSAFTLVELIITIIVIAILAAAFATRFPKIATDAKKAAAEKEMQILCTALMGDEVAGVAGYVHDVGAIPDDIKSLRIKPDDVSGFNPIANAGWNGPYISHEDLLTDPWGTDYRVIKKSGGLEYYIVESAGPDLDFDTETDNISLMLKLLG